jgi:hypothetical protein
MRIRHTRKKMILLGIPFAIVVLVLVAAAVGTVAGSRGDHLGSAASTADGSAPAGAGLATVDGEVSALGPDGYAADKSAGDTAATSESEPLAYGPDPLDPARFLVRTGDMTIYVDEGKVPEASARVTALANGLNGYVVSSQITLTSEGERPYASITVRVPSRSYDQAISRFSELGTVETLNTSTQDVTGEYVDIQARLKHYRAVERRLLGFLSRTTTVGEALTVQQRIDATQLKVEQLSGQLKSLRTQVVYGTLTVGITEPPEDVQPDKDENRFVAALGDSWDLIVGGFAAIVVGIGAVLPFLVLIAGILLLARYGLRAGQRLRRREPRAV